MIYSEKKKKNLFHIRNCDIKLTHVQIHLSRFGFNSQSMALELLIVDFGKLFRLIITRTNLVVIITSSHNSKVLFCCQQW